MTSGPSIVLAMQKESAILAFDAYLGRYDVTVELVAKNGSFKVVFFLMAVDSIIIIIITVFKELI